VANQSIIEASLYRDETNLQSNLCLFVGAY